MAKRKAKVNDEVIELLASVLRERPEVKRLIRDAEIQSVIAEDTRRGVGQFRKSEGVWRS